MDFSEHSAKEEVKEAKSTERLSYVAPVVSSESTPRRGQDTPYAEDNFDLTENEAAPTLDIEKDDN